MAEPKLIILVPAYNESERIAPVLRDYATYFRDEYDGGFEIVVVLNGCSDNTREVVEVEAEDFPEIRQIEFKDAIGKGGALIEGLKLAEECELIGFTDADGATDPKSFLNLVRQCDEHDCVIGSRRMKDSQIHQLQPTKRIAASKVYHRIVQTFFGMDIMDTQCGAKVFKSEAIRKIHPSLHTADMAVDVNILFCLKRAGFTILEAPVEWTDKIGTKVRYFRSSMAMLLSLIRLRLVYSPFYKLLAPLRPLEGWVYKKLRNPPPLRPKRVEDEKEEAGDKEDEPKESEDDSDTPEKGVDRDGAKEPKSEKQGKKLKAPNSGAPPEH